MSRTLIILYALDMFALALFTLGHCQIGQTISSVAYELDRDGKPLGRVLRPVIDWLFSRADVEHCLHAHTTFLRITGRLP